VADGASWTWSALLPNPVIGYSPGSHMNLLNAIAAYAAICKQMQLPFRCADSILRNDACAGTSIDQSTTLTAANAQSAGLQKLQMVL
jgi:hypothetical protein